MNSIKEVQKSPGTDVEPDLSGERFVRMLGHLEPLAMASSELAMERDVFSRQFLELSTAIQTTQGALEQRRHRLSRKRAQISALREEIMSRTGLISALRENK